MRKIILYFKNLKWQHCNCNPVSLGKSSGVSQQGKTLAEAVRGNQRSQGKTVIREEQPVQKPTIHEAVKYAGKQVAPSADQAPAPPVEWQRKSI